MASFTRMPSIIYTVGIYASLALGTAAAGDCEAVDCLNSGLCIDGKEADKQFTCLCSSEFEVDPFTGLCETKREITTQAPRVVALPPSTDELTAAGDDGDDSTVVAILVVIILILLGVAIYLGYMAYVETQESKATNEDREVKFLKEQGLGDVAQTVDYKPFEYENPISRANSAR